MAYEARGNERPRLARLDELDDYKVADGDPDIRGWTLKGSDGRSFGEVHDLIVDLGAMKVRYVDAELDRKATGLDRDRHVLIPIGCARLDESDDEVIVDTVSATNVTSIPDYAHGPIDRQTEMAVRDCHALGTATRTTTTTETDFYASPHFDESRFWGNRRRGRENRPYFTGPAVITEEVEVRKPIAGERGATGTSRPITDAERDRLRDERRL